jgi:inner membrane protein involved in colicin E2 resistance
LAVLAETQEQLRDRLQELAPVVAPELVVPWQAAALACLERPKEGDRNQRWKNQEMPEQWLVLITCRDENQQVELYQRF